MESGFDIDTMKAVSPDQLAPQLDELLELVQLQPLALEVEGKRQGRPSHAILLRKSNRGS